MEHDYSEVTRRIGWLRTVAAGKHGATVEILRMLYIALVRSKIAFCILLKAEGRYMKLLERLQAAAFFQIMCAIVRQAGRIAP
jgi:hypothetical protein